MKSTSKVIMGATLVMVVCLAVVLGLILVLLAELYCSLLLRRRRLRNTASAAGAAADEVNASPSSQITYPPHPSPPPPPLFGSIYAQGVLQAPRSLLFPPAVASNDNDDIIADAEPKKQRSELRHFIQIQTQGRPNHASPHHQIGLVSVAPPTPPASSIEAPVDVGTVCDKSSHGGEHHLVYISNPIYENDEGKSSSGADASFKTPDTSPSRLARSGSSGDDDDDDDDDVAAPWPSSYTNTPPLSPMKKLPADQASVSLGDTRPLDTSASDSRSVNALSSSSSASPSTSPSW